MFFSRDGKSLVVTSGDNKDTIDVWNLDAEAWAAMASNITGLK
jgi:hypothetical protein